MSPARSRGAALIILLGLLRVLLGAMLVGGYFAFIDVPLEEPANPARTPAPPTDDPVAYPSPWKFLLLASMPWVGGGGMLAGAIAAAFDVKRLFTAPA